MDIKSTTEGNNYNEKNTRMTCYIGNNKDDFGLSFNGFVWSFRIFRKDIDLNKYFSSSSTSTSCLTITCPSSCSPSVKENDIEYCISEVKYIYTDNSGMVCSDECLTGCYGDICLECNCVFGRCTY